MSQKIIQNKILNIFWLPGSGKTFLVSLIAYWYFVQKKPIIWNVDFFFKNDKRVNKRINSINDIKYIDYIEEGWLIIIDEWGLNANSRQSMSKSNMVFAEMLFLSRKKNCDLIFLAQLEFSVDKYIRFMAYRNVVMTSYFDGPNHLNFEMEIKKGDTIIWYKNVDLMLFAKDISFTYSTLESSKIDKRSEKDIEKEQKNLDKIAKKLMENEIEQKKAMDIKISKILGI